MLEWLAGAEVPVIGPLTRSEFIDRVAGLHEFITGLPPRSATAPISYSSLTAALAC